LRLRNIRWEIKVGHYCRCGKVSAGRAQAGIRETPLSNFSRAAIEGRIHMELDSSELLKRFVRPTLASASLPDRTWKKCSRQGSGAIPIADAQVAATWRWFPQG